MSPHTAFQLAVRPSLRGAALLFERFVAGQFVGSTTTTATTLTLTTAPSRKGLASLSLPSSSRRGQPQIHTPQAICLRCSIKALRSPSFSTLPPSKPPGEHHGSPPPSSNETTSSSPVVEDKDDDGRRPAAAQTEIEAETTDSNLAAAPDAAPHKYEPELPSHAEGQRSHLSAQISSFMDNLQTRFLNASQKLNDLTGYSAIEGIKERNVRLEEGLAAAQARLRAARHSYKALTAHRAGTQREVTTLLARKDTWNPSDLERFTTLYRLDHELEAQVAGAAAELTEAETDEAKLGADLNAGILKRYHEEQIWSDRIRRQSTWGTWGLMGVNVLLFLVIQFFAEPWRRRRLMKSIADSEKNVMDEVRQELGEVRAALEASGLRQAAARDRREKDDKAAEAAMVSATSAAVAAARPGKTFTPTVEELARKEPPAPPAQRPWTETLSDPELLKAAVADVYSERRIDMRMRDVSLVALEGAVAGASVVAAALVFILLRSGSSSRT
ncbi:Mdm33 family-domain-containing protein [Lasiosphaeria miniovina]|uniref:Sensitive to high expression protein 9, mitochondrial n=1 Tax=Lasiosphaeria miniovina TaxID=1954250 RepID=A0AA40ATI1_9PEZI|nr:Mdm33 family-domain-containing protein [Lasiosphaeria miniovina]KAK0721725.1 Mdm33 family-domain-containing protein [Lasiosphaeria miniovina]